MNGLEFVVLLLGIVVGGLIVFAIATFWFVSKLYETQDDYAQNLISWMQLQEESNREVAEALSDLEARFTTPLLPDNSQN